MDAMLGAERVAVPEGRLGCARKRGAPVVPVSNLKLRRVIKARIEELQDAPHERSPSSREQPRPNPRRQRAQGIGKPPACRKAPSPKPTEEIVAHDGGAPADVSSTPSVLEEGLQSCRATSDNPFPGSTGPLLSITTQNTALAESLIRFSAYTADTQGRTSFAVRRKASFLPPCRHDVSEPAHPPCPSAATPNAVTACCATPAISTRGDRCSASPSAVGESSSPVLEVSSTDLLATLRSQFGFAAFRPGQEAIVRRILGGASTLAVLPTGMGKSLCYQVAALLLAQAQPQRPRFALVVSPLVSLMTDQVKKLPRCLAGACLSAGHSSLHQTMQAIRKGRLQLLFVSPERLVQNASFLEQLRGVADQLSFACLDEAHCMSEWGHNYRTAYLHVAHVLRSQLGIRCVLAMTATSTLSCINDVCRILQVERPDPAQLQSLRQGAAAPVVCSGGVVLCAAPRHNLRLSASLLPVCRDHGERHRTRLAALRRILTSPELQSFPSIIVYVHLKKDADEAAEFIRHHICASCAAYHADKSPEDRHRIQLEFMRDDLRIIVATIAFGMGIDKSNVRAVIHLSCPQSPEAYIQEIGRAGRDGAPAHCHVIVDRHDFWVHHSKAHADALDLHPVQQLCAAAFDLPNRDANERLLTQGQEVRVFLRKSSLAFELDVKEEVLETLLALLAIHHPNLLEPRPSACHTVHVRFPEDRPEPGGPGALHETRDNRKYLSHGAPVVEAALGAPTAPSHLPARRAAPLNYHSILDGLGMEDDVLAHLFRLRATQPPIRKGTWAFNVGQLSRDLQLEVDDLLARLQELRAHKGLRVVPQGVSYCMRLKRVPRQVEVEAIALELWQRHTFVSRTARDKVVIIYGLLRDFAEVCQAKDSFDPALSEALHTALGRYLLEGPAPPMRSSLPGPSSPALHAGADALGTSPIEGDGDVPQPMTEEGLRAIDNIHATYLSRPRAVFPPQNRMCDLLTDVFRLLQDHGPQFDSGRQIARILHGLHSPKFPVETWGDHRLWGRFHDINFEAVLRLSCTGLEGHRKGTQEAD